MHPLAVLHPIYWGYLFAPGGCFKLKNSIVVPFVPILLHALPLPNNCTPLETNLGSYFTHDCNVCLRMCPFQSSIQYPVSSIRPYTASIRPYTCPPILSIRPYTPRYMAVYSEVYGRIRIVFVANFDLFCLVLY